jgi:NAD(P)-dependent dehydrogenase (short-subunit alcohol dehydrogenase family)
VRGYVCDLASLAQVRAWGEQLLQEGRRIDTLVNNAGVYKERLRRAAARGGACAAPLRCPPAARAAGAATCSAGRLQRRPRGAPPLRRCWATT